MNRLRSSSGMAKAVVLVCAALLTGCGHSEKAQVAPPVKVTVMPVSMTRPDGRQSFSGTVESAETSMLSFSVPGTITDFYVEEGQRVAKGQVLARVRSDSYVNAGNIADAELAEARDAYARLKKLHDADALPEIKWVEVQNKPKRGDIVLFPYPDNEEEDYLKRIIGLPGETLEIRNGKVYLNGSSEPLEEPYLKEDPSGNFGPYQIPDGYYFVMGDNRMDSWDSRFWEQTCVKREKIAGKAIFRYFPNPGSLY